MPDARYKFQRRQLPPGKVKSFSHSPFTLEIDPKTKISCAENGKITVIQEGDDQEFDQVILPASAFFKTVDMLNMTRKTSIIDRADIPKRD